MISNVHSCGLLDIEPGAVNPHTQSLKTIKPGTLCFVGEEEWCMCVIPGEAQNGEPNRIMIGSEIGNRRYVLPVSDVVFSDEFGYTIWCIVSNIGLVQMSANAHVRIINDTMRIQ